jgi:DNA-binding transcriptional LysR family regulator
MPLDDRIKHRLKLRDLNILTTVIQFGSMGKAAAALAMTQSAISKSIADLEHTLGVHLLDRSRRGIEPTMYGRALNQCGVTLFDDLRQGLELIDFLADPTLGELRIGTTPALATYVIPAILEPLSQQYPRVVFHVSEADTNVLYRELHDRRVDLVFTRMPERTAGDVAEEHVLFHDPLVVAAGAGNPWTKRRKVALSDLMQAPWTLSEGDSFIGSFVGQAFRASGLALPQTTVFTSSIHLRSKLLAGGRFLTMVPRFVLTGPLKDQTLRALPIDLPTTRRPVGIVTLRNRTISPVAQLFIGCAREVATTITGAAQTHKS